MARRTSAKQGKDEGPINAAADAFTARYRSLVAFMLSSAQASASVSRLSGAAFRKDGLAVDVEVMHAFRAIDAQHSKLVALTLDLYEEAGNGESKAILKRGFKAAKSATKDLPISYRFDRSNPRAREWAAREAGKLIQGIKAGTRDAIRRILRRAFANEGFPPATTAKLIRGLIGLTERDAQAVENLFDRIVEHPGKVVYMGKTPIRVPIGGMPVDRMERTLVRYATRLRNKRAMTIARTETIAAANEGQMLLWQQQIEKGNLTGHEERVWIATVGACPICSNLNGQTARLNAPFSDGTMAPPAHPRCRCTTGLVGTEKYNRPVKDISRVATFHGAVYAHDVVMIRASRESVVELASIYNVSPEYIRDVKGGSVWKES